MKFSKIKEYGTPPSIELFNELHLNQHVPCVIRNCLNELSTSKWDLDYILNKCGHKTVSARLGTNSDSYIKGKAYSLTDIKVSKYINNLKENNETSKNCYLAVQNIKHSLPELQEELERNGIPEYIQKLHSGPFLWIARKDHYEYMHVDPDEGFLMICYGRKRCKLFSYENELNDMEPHKLGSLGRTIQSNVDLRNCNPPEWREKEDLSETILPGATCLYTELNSCDALYIPAFFWHQITTMENTVSINSFWGHKQTIFAETIFNENKTNSKQLLKIFTYWFHNILEQNKAFDEDQYNKKFIRQLSRLDEVLHYFLATQWKQKLSDELIERLTRIAMDFYQLDKLPDRFPEDKSKFPPAFVIKGLKMRPRVRVPGCKY